MGHQNYFAQATQSVQKMHDIFSVIEQLFNDWNIIRADTEDINEFIEIIDTAIIEMNKARTRFEGLVNYLKNEQSKKI